MNPHCSCRSRGGVIQVTAWGGGMAYVGPVNKEASAASIRVLATRWCGDCRLARRVLDGAGVDCDLDRHPRGPGGPAGRVGFPSIHRLVVEGYEVIPF